MAFANRSKVLGSLWLSLKPIRAEIGRKVSLAAIVAIPALAALSAAFEEFRADASPIFSAILNIIEPTQIEIPMNLLRAFWAGVLFYISSIVYQIGFPSALGSYEDWRRSGDFSCCENEIRVEHEAIADGELEKRLKEIHEARSVRVVSLGTLALGVSALAALLSAYLLIIVVCLNIARVWESCSVNSVFSLTNETCNVRESSD